MCFDDVIDIVKTKLGERKEAKKNKVVKSWDDWYKKLIVDTELKEDDLLNEIEGLNKVLENIEVKKGQLQQQVNNENNLENNQLLKKEIESEMLRLNSIERKNLNTLDLAKTNLNELRSTNQNKIEHRKLKKNK
jgi:hypothetical protein